LSRKVLIPLLCCIASFGASGALALETAVPLQYDLWVLSDAQYFGEVEQDEVAVAKPSDFCYGDSLVLLAGNLTSSLDLVDENILVRFGTLGVQVWVALPPSTQSTFEANREYSYLLTEMSEECQDSIPTLRVEGVGVLGMDYLDAGNERLELEYTPPRWRCGSFMNPRC
jgi:hypothetical protein